MHPQKASLTSNPLPGYHQRTATVRNTAATAWRSNQDQETTTRAETTWLEHPDDTDDCHQQIAISGNPVAIKSRTNTTTAQHNWQNPTPPDSGREALGCILHARQWLQIDMGDS
jgi:hypothetical protein